MNKAFLLGYVYSNPMVSTTGDCKMASFTLRVPSNGGSRGRASYIRVVTFRSEADFVEKYVTIDKKLLVEGRLNQIKGSFEFEVVASNISFVESKGVENIRKSSHYIDPSYYSEENGYYKRDKNN